MLQKLTDEQLKEMTPEQIVAHVQATYGEYDTVQASVTGLQGKVQEQVAQLATLGAAKTEQEGSVTNLNAQLGTAQTQVTGLTGERDAATANYERAKLILGKYPELAQFEALGAIGAPQEGKTLEQHLDTFSQAVKATQGDAAAGVLDGSTGVKPANSQANNNPAKIDPKKITEDDYDKVMEAARPGNEQIFVNQDNAFTDVFGKQG